MRAASRTESCRAPPFRRSAANWYVRGFVFRHQFVNVLSGDRVDELDQVADAVAVDGKTEFHLRGDLVALGHSHLAHVVAETAELRRLPVGPRRRGPGPGTKFFLGGFFLPEAQSKGEINVSLPLLQAQEAKDLKDKSQRITILLTAFQNMGSADNDNLRSVFPQVIGGDLRGNPRHRPG